jgi:hypothetical protein
VGRLGWGSSESGAAVFEGRDGEKRELPQREISRNLHSHYLNTDEHT